MVQEGRLAGLRFGFDTERLLLRFDVRGGTVRERLNDVDTLRIAFFQPAGFELLISQAELAAADRAALPPRRAGGRIGRLGRGRSCS